MQLHRKPKKVFDETSNSMGKNTTTNQEVASIVANLMKLHTDKYASNKRLL